jgi:hypothetical protein
MKIRNGRKVNKRNGLHFICERAGNVKIVTEGGPAGEKESDESIQHDSRQCGSMEIRRTRPLFLTDAKASVKEGG